MPLRIGHEAAPALAADLVEVDGRALSPAQRAEVVTFVSARLALAPGHLRLGIELPSLLLALATRIPAVDRTRVVGWLARTRAPILSDVAKALRSLAIVRVYAAGSR